MGSKGPDPTLTRERALELVEYRANSGRFYCRRTGRLLAVLNPRGYIQLCLKNRIYTGHRLAWLIHYGCWPDGPLDHINRVRWDNRITNLRLATSSQNGARRLSPRNKFGYRGIVQHPDARRAKRYAAHLTVNKKCKTLGWFLTAKEAAEAYRKAHNAAFGAFSYFSDAQP